MEKIIPFSFWKNGQTFTATNITVSINFDNLVNEAIFYFSLNDENLNKLTDGNINISGKDYEKWFSNDEAYSYVSSRLGVILEKTS